MSYLRSIRVGTPYGSQSDIAHCNLCQRQGRVRATLRCAPALCGMTSQPLLETRQPSITNIEAGLVSHQTPPTFTGNPPARPDGICRFNVGTPYGSQSATLG
jgi:hypothetical protein